MFLKNLSKFSLVCEQEIIVPKVYYSNWQKHQHQQMGTLQNFDFAKDTFGNIGAFETTPFNVKLDEPFPTTTVAAVSATLVAVASVGVFFYFKKRKKVST
jgi:hypothetical protein